MPLIQHDRALVIAVGGVEEPRVAWLRLAKRVLVAVPWSRYDI